MKIALYCRVSTEDQKTDLQLDALHQYATARGHEIHQEYVDHISGATEKRPALTQLLEDARRRKFDTLVVWKIDRLGRSTQHLLAVLGELQALAIDFVSLQESIDTATPAGKMVFTFLGAVGEFERSIISERVRAGMAAAKRRGKHCGRPRARIDTQIVDDLRNSGKSLRCIAQQLGVSHQTIQSKIKSLNGTV